MYFLSLFLSMAVSLASINVNGAAERHKRLKVFGSLRGTHSDLFCLQETHLAELSQGKVWEKEWGGFVRVVPRLESVCGGSGAHSPE